MCLNNKNFTRVLHRFLQNLIQSVTSSCPQRSSGLQKYLWQHYDPHYCTVFSFFFLIFFSYTKFSQSCVELLFFGNNTFSSRDINWYHTDLTITTEMSAAISSSNRCKIFSITISDNLLIAIPIPCCIFSFWPVQYQLYPKCAKELLASRCTPCIFTLL